MHSAEITHIRLKCKLWLHLQNTHTHTQRAQRAGGQRRLIYLDDAIDLSYEPEARKETNCAGQQKEEKYHNCRITKV